ncbi:MAG: class I SAM-dependent methyltransferase [Desulfarculaceae bacterium]|nr:class I SAM-dependent methyltransferase [Desulfarculaceae bacterium]
MDLSKYSPKEQERITDLMGLLPSGRESLLEIGARDGYFTGLLRERFDRITALDLEEPEIDLPGVTTVQGDATKLQFPDESFDVVLCTEVLEHIPGVERAAAELERVARCELVLGVPYEQDLRFGRLVCLTCGKVNPPYGHLNRFDEHRIAELFPACRVARSGLVGRASERTNWLSDRLMALAGYPYGSYDQQEPCVHCGARLKRPAPPTGWRRLAGKLGARLLSLEQRLSSPRPIWMHLLLVKRDCSS